MAVLSATVLATARSFANKLDLSEDPHSRQNLLTLKRVGMLGWEVAMDHRQTDHLGEGRQVMDHGHSNEHKGHQAPLTPVILYWGTHQAVYCLGRLT